MFEGFERCVVDVGQTTIFVRRKGRGRPVLLLHGFPQTHVMWHRVAPALAERHTVICADLRGYGDSGKPSSRPDHAPYSKNSMAFDMIQLMAAQGFTRFCVAGHDRGAQVAYRMALDHRQRIERLALMNVIPIGEALERAESQFALGNWTWSLLSQPAPLPERLIASDPIAVVDAALGEWGSDRASFPPEVRKAYVDALRNRESVHAICEEYRAAATLDSAQDAKDRDARRRIMCPTLLLWSEGGPLDTWYQNAGGPLGIWREWTLNLTGRAIAGGHFFPEHNPAETIAELARFFAPD